MQQLIICAHKLAKSELLDYRVKKVDCSIPPLVLINYVGLRRSFFNTPGLRRNAKTVRRSGVRA